MKTTPLRLFLVPGLLFVSVFGLLTSADAVAQRLVLENAHLVDVAAGEISEPRSLEVHSGWIVDPGDHPPDQRIDVQGAFVIPGLAEMHAHVPPMRDEQRVQDVLDLFLAHGITTIRGMLGEPDHLVLRRELALGDRRGPRLITSGPSLNGNSVADASQARVMVRRQHEAGYDFLKLHPGLRPDTFQAIVEAADALGMPYGGHVSLAVGIERALAARQATIDHLDGYADGLVPADHPARQREPALFGFNLGDAFDLDRVGTWAERTAAAGVWNVPTQTLIENLALADADALLARPAMRYVDAATREQWAVRVRQMQQSQPRESLARFVEVRRALIRALHEAGAGLLLGADAPQIMNVPGDAVHHELELLVAAGLSPTEALATGTVHVARFLDQTAHGCLAPGCVADLVVLQADPLADISNVRRIDGVMRAGQWFDRERLDAMLEEIAARANPEGPD